MTTNQGKLFPSQEEVVEKITITPQEKVKTKEEIVRKPIPQPVEMTAKQKVNIRHKPSKEYGKILRVLEKDEKIMVLENQGEWSKVPEGYIMSQYLH